MYEGILSLCFGIMACFDDIRKDISSNKSTDSMILPLVKVPFNSKYQHKWGKCNLLSHGSSKTVILAPNTSGTSLGSN